MIILLKYILSIIIAIAFSNGIDKTESFVLEQYPTDDIISQIDASYIEQASSDFSLFIPRQISPTNTLRLQNTAKRTNSSQKNNITHYFSNSVEYLTLKKFKKENLSISQPLVIKPINRMISIGKLTI